MSRTSVFLGRGYTFLVYAFFYVPLLVMFLYSFNDNKYTTRWGGFTFKWYETLFNNSAILDAALNSLLVAVCASTLATLLAFWRPFPSNGTVLRAAAPCMWASCCSRRRLTSSWASRF